LAYLEQLSGGVSVKTRSEQFQPEAGKPESHASNRSDYVITESLQSETYPYTMVSCGHNAGSNAHPGLRRARDFDLMRAECLGQFLKANHRLPRECAEDKRRDLERQIKERNRNLERNNLSLLKSIENRILYPDECHHRINWINIFSGRRGETEWMHPSIIDQDERMIAVLRRCSKIINLIDKEIKKAKPIKRNANKEHNRTS
jgi:hypothetical protein